MFHSYLYYRLSELNKLLQKGNAQRILLVLYQSVMLNVIDYGLSLTCLSLSNCLKLTKAQNKTKDTNVSALSFLLDLSPMETRQNIAQVRAYPNAILKSQKFTPWFSQKRWQM